MRPIDADDLITNFDIAPDEWLKGRTVRLLIDEQPTIEQPQWISCSERLPAESGYYLVVYRDKFNGSKLVSIDFYTKCTAGEWWENDFGRTAIYWMPLSMPPEGDE